MSFNTGNPLPSKDILDLYDNSENIDQFANSQEDEHPDRFGVKRLTLAGLIKRSMALRNEINDFSGALTFKPEWSDVPMNVSEGVGGEGGALNLQAEALGNRSVVNKITSREALRRTYQEVGLNLVEGSFEQGAIITSATDVVLHEKTGKCYSGPIGDVPKGTSPLSEEFVSRQYDQTAVLSSYGQIRSYSGESTQIYCFGRNTKNDGGEGYFYLDATDTTTLDDDGTIIVDSLGRVWKRKIDKELNFRWFGGVDDYDVETGIGTDNLQALQNALKSMSWKKHISRVLFIPGRDYYFSNELSLLSTINNGNLQGCRIVGESRTTEFRKGTILHFAGGKVGVNTAGTDGVVLENIGIMRAKVNGARIGLLQARTQGTDQTGWAGDQRHINLFIDMGSDISYNDGFGTVAYVNLGGEETALENPQFWANTPVIFTSNSTIIATNDILNLTSKTLDLTTLTTVPLATGASNTVFEFYGLGRLVAYDYISPCCLINNAATLRLGHTFMQKRSSGVNGVTIGTNTWALETWNCFGFQHFGSIENCEFYHLQRRAFTDFDINVVLNEYTVATPTKPAWLMIDDYGNYVTERGKAIIRNNNNVPPMDVRRGDRNTLLVPKFLIRNTEISYSLNSFNTMITKFLAKTADSLVLKYNDRTFYLNSGRISTRVNQKTIGNTESTPVKVGEIVLPSYIQGSGSVAAVVKIEGIASNASIIGGGTEGGISSVGFLTTVSIARLHNASTITIGASSNEITDSASSLPGANDITSIVISLVPVEAGGVVDIYAHPIETGANKGQVYISYDITVNWSGGSFDGLLVS